MLQRLILGLLSANATEPIRAPVMQQFRRKRCRKPIHVHSLPVRSANNVAVRRRERRY